MPTGDVVRFRDADLASPARLRAIGRVIGDGHLDTINANALAERLLGDAVYANIIMLGFAWQRGLVPISLQALLRAIELNGVAVERNKQAFAWGRIAAADPDFLPTTAEAPKAETLDQLIARRAEFLTAYQNDAYAARYRSIIEKVRSAEAPLGSEALTEAVSRALFKLMAYKDEYEVARLHMQSGFLDELKREFEDGFGIHYHLAPPFLPSKRDARGRPRKRAFGQWIQMPLAMLARLKGLRGTPFDPFGYTTERRAERELIGWYEGVIDRMLGQLDAAHLPDLVAIAKAPMEIRGYGPVKDTAIAKVKPEVERHLTNLTTSVTQKMHAHG
jgi:indolepyruvate ferredoxin oxidoreductase